jgi:purine-binding chemotaxis protein CheW
MAVIKTETRSMNMDITNIENTGQFLTFVLDEEVYALDIRQVREVLDLSTITKVPRMPEFMKGVINLRGGVVPVVDLRLKFGLKATERTVDTCIIIIEISLDGETTLIGALADSVQEVLDLDQDQIKAPPKIGTRLKTEFIRGMGKKNDRFIIILDIDKVFTSQELTQVSENIEDQTQRA